MTNSLVIAQISDCHLFGDINSLHCGKNVYQHLLAVLAEIHKNPLIDYLVFTGDLTQDHSERSYQLFVQAIKQCQISIPTFFLSGNHDEPKLLNQYLAEEPFNTDKLIEHNCWQIILTASKSKVIEGPAGRVDDDELLRINNIINEKKYQLLFMHHHPVNVGYFIDKHGLQDADSFWQTMNQYPSVVGIACGHVHRALTLTPSESINGITVHTCPATSIQFDPRAPSVKALEQGPGYRLFSLNNDGTIDTSVHYIG